MTDHEIFEQWWLEQTRQGDPARRLNLQRAAFIAGMQAARATAEQSVPTPEPFGYVYRIISEMRPHDPMYRFAKTGELNPDPEVVKSWTKHAVYTEPQAPQSRDSVIEECAKVCENLRDTKWSRTLFYAVASTTCAKAIRALKSQQDAAIESQRSGDGS
jgi:hypothetical protein